MPPTDFNPYLPPEAEIGNVIDSGPRGPAWLTIFVQPRATIRRILDSGRTAAVWPLTLNVGMAIELSRTYQKSREAETTIKRLLIEVVGRGAVTGLMLLFFLGFVIWLSGRWIGGRGTQKGLRTAMAWASIPIVPLMVFEILVICCYGLIFDQPLGLQNMDRSGLYVFTGLSLIRGVATFWALFLWIKCVAEAHRFSSIKAFVAAFLGYLFVVGVGAAIVGVGLLFGFKAFR